MADSGKIAARQIQAAAVLAKNSRKVADDYAQAHGQKQAGNDLVTPEALALEAAKGSGPLKEAAQYFASHRDLFSAIDRDYAAKAQQPGWVDNHIGPVDLGWYVESQVPATVSLGDQSFKLEKFLGSGWTSSTFRIEPVGHRDVLKVLRRDDPHAINDTVEVAQKLRADAGFRDRFGDIIPDMVSVNGEAILMDAKSGKGFDELGPAEQRVAEGELNALFEQARRIVAPRPVDTNRENFFFEPSGKIRGWVDFIPGE